MAKYRKISPRIWNDAKFRGLSDNAKLVFFMLLTHPQTSAIGTLRAYVQGLAPEMGWTEKAFREAFGEVLAAGMVRVSERDGLMWLPNFMKFNAPESPNVLKSWAPALEDCPECSLKSEVYSAVKGFVEGLGEGFRKAFGEAFAQPSPNQEQEQEQEQEQDIRENANAFLSTGEPADDNSEPLGCPHRQIIALYHEVLPELPQVRKWRDNKAKDLRTRWREKVKEGRITDRQSGLEYFRRFFEFVRESGFLMGRVSQRDRKPFFADLGWLVTASNFDKVLSRRYHDKESA